MSTAAPDLERRRRRQAEALRANLQKRKAQADVRASRASRQGDDQNAADADPRNRREKGQ
jgi:hypothetical protein